MTTMRACVLTGIGRMELSDVPRPVLGPRDVLVEVAAVGVCGTDFHIVSGESNYHLDERGAAIPLERAPQILGHEITGVVRECGAGVRDLAAGERVVIDQGIHCASVGREPPCEYCATGDSHQCEHYAEHGITGLPGGFAELVAVPAANCVRLRSNLAPVEAAFAEPLACVIHSCDRAARAEARYPLVARDGRPGPQTIVVLGAGPAGLLFVQWLRRGLGFEGLLLVSEPDEKKRALAEDLGAVTIDPRTEDPTEAVLEATQGRRAEVLIEASGSGAAFARIPALIRKQATVLLYGIGHGGAPLELLNPLQWREPTLVASVGASGAIERDGRPSVYLRALECIESGRVRVAPLVTHRYAGLEQVPRAFGGDHARPGYVKGVVELAGWGEARA
jgi:L-iditol 2-dehydrogenase